MQERSREQDGSTGCRRSDGKWENAIKTILIYVVNKFWQAQQFVRSGEFSRALQTLGAALKSFPDDSKVCSVILEAVNQSPKLRCTFCIHVNRWCRAGQQQQTSSKSSTHWLSVLSAWFGKHNLPRQ